MEMNTQSPNLLHALSYVISRLRRDLALSQDRVAEKAGLSRAYFSDIERGRRNFSVLTLNTIAEALNTQGSIVLREAEVIANSDK